MKAKDFYENDLNALRNYIILHFKDLEQRERDLEELSKFFNENAEVEYNEFITLMNNQYGHIVEIAKKEQLKPGEAGATIIQVIIIAVLIVVGLYLIF